MIALYYIFLTVIYSTELYIVTITIIASIVGDKPEEVLVAEISHGYAKMAQKTATDLQS